MHLKGPEVKNQSEKRDSSGVKEEKRKKYLRIHGQIRRRERATRQI